MSPDARSLVPAEPWKARLAIALAGVAGYVDAVGYLTLSRLFTAHMSGNSARLGVLLAQGHLRDAATPAVAIVVFVLSIAAGTALMEAIGPYRWASSVVFGAEAAGLAAYLGYGQTHLHGGTVPADTSAFWTIVVLAVTSMGLQTATLQRVSRRAVRTTYVSGMLTRLAEESVNLVAWRLNPDRGEADSYLLGELGMGTRAEASQRVRLITAIWLTYAGCAIGGGYLNVHWELRCLAVPLAALLAVIGYDLRHH